MPPETLERLMGAAFEAGARDKLYELYCALMWWAAFFAVYGED